MSWMNHSRLDCASHVYVGHSQTRFPPGYHQMMLPKHHHIMALVRPLVVPIRDGYSHLRYSIMSHEPGLRFTDLHHQLEHIRHGCVSPQM